MTNEKLKNRIIEIDIIRGICIFLMILDHLIYDIYILLPMIFKDFPGSGISNDIYLFSKSFFRSTLRTTLHYIVCFIFLALTGISCSFSRSNIKRGIKLLVVSIALSIVSLIIGIVTSDLDMTIVFGVLHCISLSLIIIGLLERFIPNKSFYLILGVVMVALGLIMYVDAKRILIGSANIFKVIFEGIIGLSVVGSDWFPILLFGGQILIGVFLGKVIYSSRKSIFKNANYSNNVVTFVGRNSLIIYLAHQVIIPFILIIICLICGFSLDLSF